MTAFDEDEQLYSDLDWYAIDRDGRLGQFATAGHRLLPPSFASNKEMTEKLSAYFENYPYKFGNYTICSDLKKNNLKFTASKISTITGIKTIDERMRNQLFDEMVGDERQLGFFRKMSSRGLYTYDSNSFEYSSLNYFRVAIPKEELRLDDLPQDIKSILQKLRLPEISFAESSLISENITDKL